MRQAGTMVLAVGVLLAAAGLADATQADSGLSVRQADRSARLGVRLSGAERVLAVAVSPSGEEVAVADQDGRVRLWDVASGEPVTVVSKGGEPALSLAWGPAGGSLLVGRGDGAVEAWDARKRRLLGRVGTLERGAGRLARSADGGTVAATGPAQSIGLWRVSPAKALAEVRPGRPVKALALSPDGSVVYAGLGQAGIRAWDVATGRELARMALELGSVQELSISPDGAHLLVGGFEPELGAQAWIVRRDTGAVEHTLTPLQARYVSALAWLDSGRIAAVADDQGRVSFWDAASGRAQGHIQAHTSALSAVAPALGGRALVTHPPGGQVRLVHLASSELARTTHLPRLPTQLALSRDGGRLALVSATRSLDVIDPTSGETLRELEVPTDILLSVALAPDGGRVAAGTRGGRVLMWDTATGAPRDPLVGHQAPVETLAWAEVGGVFASASIDGMLRIWDVDDGHGKLEIGGAGVITGLAVSGDGRYVVGGTWAGSRRAWDIASATQVVSTVPSTPQGERVLALAMAPDGRTFVTSGTQGLVRVRTLEVERSERALLGHGGRVGAVAISADGLHVATGGEDRTIRIWRLADGEPERVLLGHTDEVTGLAFDPSGDRLYSVGEDRTLRQWRLSAR